MPPKRVAKRPPRPTSMKAKGRPKRKPKRKGRGFFSAIADGAKKLLSGAANLVADTRVNRLYPGEEHGLILLPDRPNHYSRAQYMGANTQVSKRLLAGQNGLSPVDTVSKKHDIAYSLAKSKADIAKADEDMLRAVARVNDAPFNKNQARLIAVKRAGDLVGMSIGSTFGSKELDNNPDLRQKYQQEWERLDKAGFGKKRRAPRKK